jgi:hypothetical protein
MNEKKKDNRNSGPANQKKPFIGVFWECCKIYSRIYLNKKETAYVGWCPRCAKRVQLNLSPIGSKSRFFTVS